MQVDIRHRPAFAAIFMTLAPGESVLATADAMASMSDHIHARARLFGSLFTAILRRLFGRGSLFLGQFSCPADGRPGEVVLSQPTCGDVHQVDLNGTALYIQPGAFIACGPQVTLSVGWAGLASWFGGEGLFRLKVSGIGPVWIGAYGSIIQRTIDRDYLVDTGHLLAYEPTVSLSVALSGGVLSSFFGGEGFVSRVQGPGQIYMQSRSIESLAEWTNAHLS